MIDIGDDGNVPGKGVFQVPRDLCSSEVEIRPTPFSDNSW